MNILRDYRTCSCCNKRKGSDKSQWWHLSGYGNPPLHGFFCAQCFEKVSLDAYGNANHPEEREKIVIKMKG